MRICTLSHSKFGILKSEVFESDWSRNLNRIVKIVKKKRCFGTYKHGIFDVISQSSFGRGIARRTQKLPSFTQVKNATAQKNNVIEISEISLPFNNCAVFSCTYVLSWLTQVCVYAPQILKVINFLS